MTLLQSDIKGLTRNIDKKKAALEADWSKEVSDELRALLSEREEMRVKFDALEDELTEITVGEAEQHRNALSEWQKATDAANMEMVRMLAGEDLSLRGKELDATNATPTDFGNAAELIEAKNGGWLLR